MKNVSVFIKTFEKDYEWLPWCLESIRKNLRGWHKTYLLYDYGSPPPPAVPDFVNLVACEGWPDSYGINRGPTTTSYGYQMQKVHKLEWERGSFEGDAVLQIDSDSMVTEPADIRDLYFAPDGRPIWWVSAWANASRNEMANWSRGRELFAPGSPLNHMRRVGFLLTREATNNCALYLQKRFGSVANAFLGSKVSLSVYNTFGLYLERYAKDRDGYAFQLDCYPQHWPIKTFHSWTGLTPEKRVEMDSYLGY
jgi:hypothetical protein